MEFTGTEEEGLPKYRHVRNQIKAKIEEWVEERLGWARGNFYDSVPPVGSVVFSFGASCLCLR